jgi:hypothetical protein
MSYILDALKKASEQRGESAPGFRRFVSSPPVPGQNRRAWAWRGVLAVCAAAVGAIAFVAVRTAPDVIVTAPPRTPVVAHAPADAPHPPTEAPRAPTESPRAPAEAPRAPVAASPPPRVVAPLISIPRAETPPRATPAKRLPAVAVTPPRSHAPVAVTPPPSHPPVAPPMQVPASSPMPVPSAPPVLVPAASVDPKLKLEVLVYSDVASERMVFINGRKYVQGDTVAERARVEEIHPDGVVLSEQGRRFTLRQ